MEIIEKVNPLHLEYLLSLDKKTLSSYITKGKKKDVEIEYKKVVNYLKNMKKVNGEMKHLYKYTLNTNWENGGRLFSGTSIQNKGSIIRGFLFKHTTDYDMNNCHPKILLYLCKKHELNRKDYVNLEYYCNNREEILSNMGDRNTAKNEFLKVINDSKKNRKATGFLKDLDLECKKIQKTITAIDEYKSLVDTIPAHKQYNFYGCAINRILCKYENEILQDMLHIVNKNQLELSSLMFDGLMVNGDNDVSNEMEEYLKSKWENLDMKIGIKPHNETIKMPVDWEPIVVDDYKTLQDKIIAEGKSYEQVKEYFEKTHSKIIDTSNFIKKTTNNNLILFNEANLKVSYKHIKYHEVEEKKGRILIIKKEFVPMWLQDEDMLYFNSSGVYPPNGETCPPKIYNMWVPFAMEEITEYEERKTECDFLLNHIRILCNNDDEVYQYFLKWVAQMIQYPSVKTICPTIISKPGAGKGTFMKMMSRMLGSKKVGEHTSPSSTIWGQFNSDLLDEFFINLNEMSKKERINSENKIKGLITDPTVKINIKGIKGFTIPSFHRFMGTTNSEEPLNLSDGNGDRRNLVIRASDELIKNYEYFKKINSYIEDDDVIKTLYEYLKKIPNLDKFGSLPIPQTEYQKELTEISRCAIYQFAKDFVYENYNESKVSVLSKKLYQEFNRYIKNNGILYECNSAKFGLRLKRLEIDGYDKKHTNKGALIQFDIEKMKKYFGIECLVDYNSDEEIDVDSDSDSEEYVYEEKKNEVLDNKMKMTINGKVIDIGLKPNPYDY